MKKTLRLKSPAKVNLRLEIVKKREDGYHEIRTLFQKMDLCDTIHFSLGREEGISITTSQPLLPVDRRNLVYRASQAIFSRLSYQGGVAVHIDKKIPLGAGLGGGSSNAATTLQALNQLLGGRLSLEEMMAMAVRIGADVPFFLMEGGSALATGIGERLEKVELPTLWFILIYPNFEVSTAWAYQNIRLTKETVHLKIQEFLSTPDKITRILKNDLEQVVSGKFPQIDQMKDILTSAGAIGSLMTGSGPTVFGIFPEKGEALRAYRDINKRVRANGWIALKARSLP
jgi:4-diphosphocytidyl-2-C-methyl-D-erythritol kinase